MALKKNLLITLLFTVIASFLVAAIASPDAIPPSASDALYHVMNIFEAHQGLQQGQFPLRVATDVEQGWLYPIFQFYAPFAYSVAGIIGFIILHNPWNVYKITLCLAGVLGAWYAYKLYLFLFKDEVAALLGAALYLLSPYLLVNITVRCDFTEAFTQCILPATLYYAFRLFYAEKKDRHVYYFAAALILAYYCLATSHFITFATTSFFLALLLLCLAFKEKRLFALPRLICCALTSLILAAWYLGPILFLHAHLLMGTYEIFSPWGAAWLSSLPTLLAPKSVIGNPILGGTPITPGVGLIILMSVGYWLYQAWMRPPLTPLIRTSLILWWIAFFMVWSPVNFWRLLPHIAYVVQFPYRLTTILMWLGGLLFIGMLVKLMPSPLKIQHGVIGLFCIGIAAAQWIPPNGYAQGSFSVHSFNMAAFTRAYADHGYPQDYLIDFKTISSQSVDWKVNKTQPQCHLKAATLHCQFQTTAKDTTVQLPLFYYPHLLDVQVDGHSVPYFASLAQDPNPTRVRLGVSAPSVDALASIHLLPGSHQVIARFSGLMLANWISRLAWMAYGLFILALIMRRLRS